MTSVSPLPQSRSHPMADLSDLVTQTGVIVALKAQSKKRCFEDLPHRAAQIPGSGRTNDLRDPARARAPRHHRRRPRHRHPARQARRPSQDRGPVRAARRQDRFRRDRRPAGRSGFPAACAGRRPGPTTLKALARVSRLLRNTQVCEKLRGAEDRAALYAILTEPLASSEQPDTRPESERPPLFEAGLLCPGRGASVNADRHQIVLHRGGERARGRP